MVFRPSSTYCSTCTLVSTRIAPTSGSVSASASASASSTANVSPPEHAQVLILALFQWLQLELELEPGPGPGLRIGRVLGLRIGIELDCLLGLRIEIGLAPHLVLLNHPSSERLGLRAVSISDDQDEQTETRS